MTDEFTRMTKDSHDAPGERSEHDPEGAPGLGHARGVDAIQTPGESAIPQPNDQHAQKKDDVPQPERLTWQVVPRISEQVPRTTTTPSAPAIQASAASPGAAPGEQRNDAVAAAQPEVEPAGGGVEAGLADLDPLIVRPRTSSRVMCLAFALALLLVAGVVWWLGVRTMDGQSYDEMVFTRFMAFLPDWIGAVVRVFTFRYFVVATSLAIGAVAVIVVIVRRRWWLLLQMLVFAALSGAVSLLKYVLPRPFLINIVSTHDNSAPSGHTVLAAAACLMLVVAVARAWRAVAALAGFAYTVFAGLSMIAGGWHRPTDVVMALLAVAGAALLTLACTRVSGMDEPGKRASSASIQIVGSVLTTAGLLGCLYAAYVIWQVQPGLGLADRGIQNDARISAIVLIAGVTALAFGLGLVMRQLTASPLSKIGLVGAPPLPPNR